MRDRRSTWPGLPLAEVREKIRGTGGGETPLPPARQANGPQAHVGLDEIAGSSGIGRFTDNALTVEFHKTSQESDVLGPNGFTQITDHDKTVTLAKCKDGPGTNWRIACDLGKDRLDWIEHGIIKARVKGGRT